jgi:hypothetical protein
MERIFSYIFTAILSLLFISNINEIKSSDTVSGFFYRTDNTSHFEGGNSIESSLSNDLISSIFSRYGSSAQSFHLLKEKQYFCTGSFLKPVLSAFIKAGFSITFSSFNIHIPDKLKSLLYPKHCFW